MAVGKFSLLRSTPKEPTLGHDRRHFAKQTKVAVDVKKKKLSTKAQVFSLITLLMSALFILLFGTIASIGISTQAEVAQAQTVLIETFMGNLDFYIGAMIAQGGYPILEYTVEHLEDPGSIGFYTDYEMVFNNCLLSGRYNDTSVSPIDEDILCDDGSDDNSLTYHLGELFSTAETAYDANIDYEIISVTSNQTDAYTFTTEVVVFVELTRRGIVWTQIAQVSKELDLYYLFNPTTLGDAYEHRVRYHPGRLLTRSTNINGDLSLLQAYIDNDYYFRDTKATSFIDKLEGVQVRNLTYSNPLGVTTIIDGPYYASDQRPHLDFLFTSEANFSCTALRRIDDSAWVGVTIDDDILLPLDYAVNDLDIDTDDLMDVCGCCDALGCDPLCS